MWIHQLLSRFGESRPCPGSAQGCSVLRKLLPLCQKRLNQRAAVAALALRADFTPTFSPHGETAMLVFSAAGFSACPRVFSLLTCFEMHPNMDTILPVVLQLLLLLMLPLSHLPLSCSTSPQRGNCRPIRFEPPMLDFHEQ